MVIMVSTYRQSSLLFFMVDHEECMTTKEDTNTETPDIVGHDDLNPEVVLVIVLYG